MCGSRAEPDPSCTAFSLPSVCLNPSFCIVSLKSSLYSVVEIIVLFLFYIFSLLDDCKDDDNNNNDDVNNGY